MPYNYTKVENHSKAFIYGTDDQKISYNEAYEKIEKITYIFNKYNIKRGDIIALMSSDDVEISLLFIASLLNGITVTIIDNETKKLRLNTILNLLEIKAIFIDKTFVNEIDKNLECSIFAITGKNSFMSRFSFSKNIDYTKEIKSAKKVPFKFQAGLDDVAYILFTSGTTSSPKGVEITYKNLTEHTKTLQKVYKVNHNSKILNILDLSHVDGIVQGPVLAFFSHITLYRPFKFKINRIEKLLKIINKEEVTHFVTVPTMLSLIEQLGQAFSSDIQQSKLYCIASAGALLEFKLWKNFENIFDKKIMNVYGLTESVTGGIFTELGNSKHIGTIGTPIDCKAKIVDDLGNELGDSDRGELLLFGSNIMKGYYKNSEATNAILKNGWLYTGDLAIREKGVYTIVGRKKNVILTGGFAVYPEEIIEVINTYEHIKESTVFGIKNEIWGEEIVACVVTKEGTDIQSVDIVEYCREHLETHKIPKKIKFLDELPKGRSGKIIISEIKEKYFSKVDNRIDLINKKIFEVASMSFLIPLESISEKSSPESISSWDSLGHLEFIAMIEESFDIHFNTTEMLQIEDMKDVIRVIKRKL